MNNIYLIFSAATGQNYAATIERLSDGYFRQDDAEVFNSGLSFGDKDISLSEGTGENRGSYTGVLNASGWNDGLYVMRVHDTVASNKVVSSNIFGVVQGHEVPVGEEQAVYHSDINFTRDIAADEYTCTWFKNGIILTTGVTSPTIRVIKRTDGSDLVATSAMTQIGSTHNFKYDASSSERQLLGENYVVLCSATIDSATRSYSWILGRDTSSGTDSTGNSLIYADSLSFSSGNGILTVGRTNAADLTASLDGRYIQGWILQDQNSNQVVVSGGLPVLSISGSGLTTVRIVNNTLVIGSTGDGSGSLGSVNTDDYVTAAAFNTGNGNLVLTRASGGTVTGNLDGRYLTSYTETQTLNDVLGLGNTTSLGLSGQDISGNAVHIGGGYLNFADGSQQTTAYISVSGADDYVTSASFNTSDGILTLSRRSGGSVTVDLDGRYLTSYTETQTLADVLALGNTTSLGLSGQGISGNSLHVGGGYLNFADGSQQTTAFTGNLVYSAGTGLQLAGQTFNIVSPIITLSDGVTTSGVDISDIITVSGSGNTTVSLLNGVLLISSTGGAGGAGTIDGGGQVNQLAYWVDADTISGSNVFIVGTSGLSGQNIFFSDGTAQTTAYTGQGWIVSDGSDQSNISDGQTLTFSSAGNVSVSLVGQTLTISGTAGSGADGNDYVNSAAFNTGNGVLTLTRTDLGIVDVDLDGRYLPSGSTTLEYVTQQGNTTAGISGQNISGHTFTVGGGGISFTGGVQTIPFTGGFDNYAWWNLRAGANSGNISGQQMVTFTASNAAAVTYTPSTRTLNVSATNTTYTAGTGLRLVGTVFHASGATSSGSGVVQLSTSVDGLNTRAVTPLAVQNYVQSQLGNQYWAVSDGSSGTNISSGETVFFTGDGSITVSLSGQTIRISGSTASGGGGGGGYDFNISVTGLSDTITSGQTLTFSGSGATSVTYDSVSNTVFISSTDTVGSGGSSTGITGGGITNQLAYFNTSSSITGNVAATFDGNKTYLKTTYGAVTNSGQASGTITFDMNQSNLHLVTLTGNAILGVVNTSIGQKFMIRITQDNSGSRTVSWWNNINWAEGGTPPTLTTTSGRSDMFGFVMISGTGYDGFVIGQDI